MSRTRKQPVWMREATAAPAVADRRGQVALPLADNTAHRPAPSPDATRRLWFCVHLPALPLEACGRRQTPFAVVEDQQGVCRVLLANPRAAAAGVVPGQPSNAALALIPELELELRCTLKEQQVLEALAAWLEQFSSFVTMADSNVLLLEIAGSLRLFGGLRRLRQRVSDGLERQGFAASLAIAPTPLAATWLARAGRRVCVRDSTNLMTKLRPLPIACLDWPPASTDALAGTGVTNVGDCLRLPREGFARRFGAHRLLELDRAVGRLPDPRLSWRSPERFCADFEMTEEQSDREQLLAICHELLTAHERFLRARQLGTQRLHFSFFHLKAPATVLSLGCTRAERSAACFSELLAIRFERLTLAEPVIAIRLQGGHTQALTAGSGSLAFDPSTRRTDAHSMTQLAERLAARMGGEVVNGVTTVAEHRPQHAWRPRNLLAGRGNDALSIVRQDLKRPLWMLPEPAPLDAEQDWPLHFGRLTLLEGPERLETGWWDDDGIARDYYTAVNPRGMRLWIFRNRSARSRWYLHGIFG